MRKRKIPHFPLLLARLGNLDGVIVTADALHTQPTHADWLHAHGAHYVFTVKTNQRRLRDRIMQQNWAQHPPGHTETEKSHGRITRWEATSLPAPARIGFPHAAQTIRLTRDRTHPRTGENTREHVFVITSLPPEQTTPGELAGYVRGHRGIENRLHWIRDTAYEKTPHKCAPATPHTWQSTRSATSPTASTASPEQPTSPPPFATQNTHPDIIRTATGL